MADVTRIGPHRLACASIHEPAAAAILPPGGVDVLYTDPPWGEGHVKVFATMRAKATGAPATPPIAFGPMLDHLTALAEQHVRGHVFIEMGMRWGDEVEARMRDRFGPVQRIEVVYGGKRLPSLVLYAPARGQPAARLALDGLTGQRLVTAALSATLPAGGTVWDPFTGHGMTAKATARLGGTFIGSEFNSKRLARTIDVLRRAARS